MSFIAKVFLIGKLMTLKDWFIKKKKSSKLDATYEFTLIKVKFHSLRAGMKKGHSFPFSLIFIINNHKESLREIFTKRVSIPHRIVSVRVPCARLLVTARRKAERHSRAFEHRNTQKKKKRFSVKCFAVSWDSLDCPGFTRSARTILIYGAINICERDKKCIYTESFYPYPIPRGAARSRAWGTFVFALF